MPEKIKDKTTYQQFYRLLCYMNNKSQKALDHELHIYEEQV